MTLVLIRLFKQENSKKESYDTFKTLLTSIKHDDKSLIYSDLEIMFPN